jgi:hypothetical protein
VSLVDLDCQADGADSNTNRTGNTHQHFRNNETAAGLDESELKRNEWDGSLRKDDESAAEGLQADCNGTAL